MKKRVSFHTLGCRLNQSETDSLMRNFKQNGYAVVPESETQLLGVFPSRTQAYSYAQKLQKQNMNAIIDELDNGKWAVRVPKNEIKK